MRQRNVKNQEDIISSFDRFVQSPEKMKGTWHKEYKQVQLEIGIGKGQFLYNMAKQNPDILYVGIELNRGVVALAIKKLLRQEQIDGMTLKNIKLFSFDAIKLNDVFDGNEVDKIYLNFSDPWPKKKHEKRRLTSNTFLEVYKEILNQNGIIEQKTDNRKLFEYSILSYNQNNLFMEKISLDLYKDIEDGNIQYNIPTEYEEKFREKGPIYKIEVKF